MSAICARPVSWSGRCASLLVVGGFVFATPGGGIVPLSQMQMMALGLAILVPTLLVALLLVRRNGAPALQRSD